MILSVTGDQRSGITGRNKGMRLLLATAAIAVIASTAYAQAARQDKYFTTSDGVKLHYVEMAGQGTPVVLIHGYGSHLERNWMQSGIAAELSKNHRVIAVDTRGHGMSDKPKDPAMYGGNRYPQDILELMDSLKIQKAHFAGYSMGGGILRQVIGLAPQRVISASFGGSGLPDPNPAKLAADKALDKTGVDPNEGVRRVSLDGDPQRDNAALAAVNKGRELNPPKVPAVMVSQLNFPIQVMNGEFDAPHAKSGWAKREGKNVEVVVIPGRVHITAGADPMYKAALVNFINKNDPK